MTSNCGLFKKYFFTWVILLLSIYPFTASAFLTLNGNSNYQKANRLVLSEVDVGMDQNVIFFNDTFNDTHKTYASLQPIYDGGNNPIEPGCDCVYSLPSCQGDINARIVDECYPHNGVTLQEKEMDKSCNAVDLHEYDCRDVMNNPRATCRLESVICCGVATYSAYCAAPN